MSTTQETTTSACLGIRLVALSAEGSQGDCQLNHAVSILGSSDACDVILEAPGVAEAHAAIVRHGGTGYLCDLGARGGSSLNGQLVRWARLMSGDRIRVGPFEFRVEIDGDVSTAAATPPIFALQGDEEIGLITSIDPVLLVGSNGGCDVVLNDPNVQPQHCLVVWTDHGPIARDLTGERLTFVDGRPVSSALLLDGNTIGVGSYEFIFEVESEPTSDQVAGGRFSDPSGGGARSDTEMVGLVAGRFGQEDDGANARADESRQADAAPASVKKSAASAGDPNFFDQIIADVGADLSRLAAMEATSPEFRESTAESEAVTAAHEPADAPAVSTMVDDEICAALSEGQSPEAILRKAEQLQRKTTEMRRRVADAQRALDARASKHREEILRERQRLREKRALLQMQAKALIEASNPKKPSGDETDSAKSVVMPGSSRGGDVLEINDTPAQNAFVEYVANESRLRKLLSGEADVSEVSDFNAKETERILNDPRSYADEDSVQTLEERVAELIRVAQAERKEIERGEALVESLRFETERQRRALTRRQEKLKSRESSLEDRFRSLAKAREAIRKERAPLLARLKALDADEAVIRDRLGESELNHAELVKEAEAIDELQESLETRERALLHKLELERQRLLARQTELKRKAAKLAKAAREKRMSIEKEVLRQQADLEAREAELRARRHEIEEVARGELEKTAGELEQVLGVRLSEIETELEERRIDLDTKVQELAGLNHAHLRASRVANDSIDAPLRRIASEFNVITRLSDEDPEPRNGGLDHLEAEIAEFSRRTEPRVGIEDDEAPIPLCERETDGEPHVDAAALGLGLDTVNSARRRDDADAPGSMDKPGVESNKCDRSKQIDASPRPTLKLADDCSSE